MTLWWFLVTWKNSLKSILALNYFSPSLFISSYILLQIVCLAILICLDPLLLPTHTKAWAFAALWSCSVTDTAECFSHQSSSYHQTLHPISSINLQKAHSSIIFPFTDYVVTSLIHDWHGSVSADTATRVSFYLPFYFTILHFWRGLTVFYLHITSKSVWHVAHM